MRKFSLFFGISLCLVSVLGIIAGFQGWRPITVATLFIALLLVAGLAISCTRHVGRLLQTNSRKSILKTQALSKQLLVITQELHTISKSRRDESTPSMKEQVLRLENNLGRQIEEALRAGRMDIEAAKNQVMTEISHDPNSTRHN